MWGNEIDLFDDDQIGAAYNAVALSIAAFERTALFAPFDSKYDYYLQACLESGGNMNDCAKGIGRIAKKVAKKIFTQKELKGMQLFMGENDNNGILTKGEGAMCSACHVAEWIDATADVVSPSWAPEGWIPPIFTDFTFDNLGVPENPEAPNGPSISEARGSVNRKLISSASKVELT